jgi:TolB protein
MRKRSVISFLLFAALPFAGSAQRQPVLPQIDLPHPYYYRELYLPQLTSGPSSVCWMPDSKEVVYSMAGSLWRQKLDSTTAVQLTDSSGYDYQPDCAPDGKSIVYVSYQKDAMELWLLDLASGKSTQLTDGGSVNVEPRWSPDGKRIVFVSTSYNKRFHIFRAGVANGKLENIVRLTGETKSDLPRYYYSEYDMEINPVWTRDGEQILYISNKGHIHGTGGFWLQDADPGAPAREILYEETNWKARPDFSPDGSRMVYSSYLGRQWHQLWVMPAKGGDAFFISYGNFDNTNARWSPDGKQIAYITNASGNVAIAWQTVPGAEMKHLAIGQRRYLRPHGSLWLETLSGNSPAAVRISVTDSSGRFYSSSADWIQADDGYDRSKRPFEAHYFFSTGKDHLDLPAGTLVIEVTKGFEYRPERREVDIRPDESVQLRISLRPLDRESPLDHKWISGDLHVHMNYGGTYKNNVGLLAAQAAAEGLDFVNELAVNKEQRFPDEGQSGSGLAPGFARKSPTIFGQEFHTSYWGHRGLLGITDHILLPGYAGYPNTAASSLFPMNADVYDMAHAQRALVGAVHPFDEEPDPFANPPQRITDELPVDVALGKLDYMEIVGFSDHKSTAAVWYRLLNLGFRLPAGAGTDATTNYAAPIRGQVGFDRIYAWVPAAPAPDVFLDAIKKGRTFATNGPLIEFTLAGHRVGDELKFDAPQNAVPFTARLRSIVLVDHLEVVCNSKVMQTLKLEGQRNSADVQGALAFPESGWCVLRTYTDRDVYPVLDKYAYATTSPVYVTIADRPHKSPEDAKYFVAWIDRVTDITSRYPDWNTPEEKESVLRRLREARDIYEHLQ